MHVEASRPSGYALSAHRHLSRLLRALAPAASVFAVVAGAASLLGWVFGAPSLAEGLFGGVTMEASTSLGITLAGVSLALLAPEAPPRVRRHVGLGLAGVVLLLGLGTLAEHLVALGDDGAPRASALSAMCLGLSSLGLLTLDRPSDRRVTPAQLLTLAVLVIALFGLLGFTYAVEPRYGVASVTGLALHTAAAFLALGLGLLAARPDRGVVALVCARDAGGLLLRRLLLPTVLLPTLVGVLMLVGLRAGLYRAPFGTSALVLVVIVVFATLIWRSALILSRVARGRDRAEAAERELSQRIVDIVEGLSQGFFSVDRDYLCTYVNREGESLIQRARDEVIGRSMWDVFPQSAAAAFQAAARRAMAEGVAVQHEAFDAAASAWIESRFFPTAHGLAIFTQDVTERRLRDDERAELLESERAARADAQRANRIKDEFLATLSHELRTPLNAILGWAQLIGSGGRPPDEIKKGLGTIERNARLQAQLIDDLLDVSRIINGKLRLEVRRVDLAEIVESATAAVRPAADLKGVQVEAIVDRSASLVAGDAARLQQIAWNLLSNAIKFTPKGGLVQARVSHAALHVVLEVVDTGQGIDPDFIPHVFDRFRQADASTTRRHGGLGLGLAIVRHLTELHGGEVRVRSDGVGRGATFSVRLPMAHAKRDSSGDAALETDGGRPDLRGARVLVVDDEVDVRVLVRRILEDHGALVDDAGSAAEGLAMLGAQTIDVLVTDIGMPGEDGYELLRKARATDGGATVPAVALTAFARIEDKRRALAAGFAVHMVKPIEPSELVSVVARLAALRRGDTHAAPRD